MADSRIPTVSVVIPTRNGEAWIREAIDSVLAQQDVDLELVVADHASTDGTATILSTYSDDPRVRLVALPDGGGAQAGWNGASAVARGRYIKLLCHDDTLLPGVLARQVALLETHPEAALTACRRDIVDGTGKVLFADWGLRGFTEPLDGHRAIRRAVRQGINPFGEPGCVMTRRALLERVGYWDGRRPYVIDLSTYFRLLELGNFIPDLSTGATFLVSPEQLSFHLLTTQSRQVSALHQEAMAAAPVCQRQLSVAMGGAKAFAAAQARRLVYRRLSRSTQRGTA